MRHDALRMARCDFCCISPFQGKPWVGKVEQQQQRPVILLADDDRLTAAAWTTVLRMNRFEVVWAPDGGAAWGPGAHGPSGPAADRLGHACIDSPELCRILRSDPVLAKVLIILASSLSLPPAGAPDLHNLFLQKPVDAVALLTAIRACGCGCRNRHVAGRWKAG